LERVGGVRRNKKWRPISGLDGTLFDLAAAAKGCCRDVLGDACCRGRHADFWHVTGDALDFALETLAIDKMDYCVFCRGSSLGFT
jgi:hypothetical protein